MEDDEQRLKAPNPEDMPDAQSHVRDANVMNSADDCFGGSRAIVEGLENSLTWAVAVAAIFASRNVQYVARLASEIWSDQRRRHT